MGRMRQSVLLQFGKRKQYGAMPFLEPAQSPVLASLFSQATLGWLAPPPQEAKTGLAGDPGSVLISSGS
jgi:hypothetical protein